MSPAQRSMLFTLFNAAMVRAGITGKDAITEERHRITEAVFGKPMSWSQFKDSHVDRMKTVLKRMATMDLDAALEEVRYEHHDAAQKSHVPDPRPGKRQFKLNRPRTAPSQYEQITDVDDPGERRRLTWFISRSFHDPYIAHIAKSHYQSDNWRDLPIPHLTALRDTVRNNLSRFITRVKSGAMKYDFQLGPHDGTSNRAIIDKILREGPPVSIPTKVKSEPIGTVEIPF